jgi:hypothetical protein
MSDNTSDSKAALTQALTNQVTIQQLSDSGKAAQDKRKKLKKEGEEKKKEENANQKADAETTEGQ